VHEPKDIAPRGACAEVHLPGPIAFADYNLAAKPRREIRRSIRASAIRDNNFGSRHLLAKMLKKRAYQLRLIVNWNDNGELHSNSVIQIVSTTRLFSKASGLFFLINAENYRGTNYNKRSSTGGIHMITRLIISAAMALFFLPAAKVNAQEHPEHPEHPTKGKAAEKRVSTADISTGIKSNIAAKSKESPDGKFHVTHEGQDLSLDLTKVHDDRLQDLGGGKYFACVDMKGTDGKTYDIDFFLTGQPGQMKVTETSVHKIDGKPLYNWKEENGTWHKMPAS